MQFSFVVFRVLQNMLHYLQVPVTDEYLRRLIGEQLFHGSVRTITEVLKDLNIETKVYQLEEGDLQHVEYPFIVYFKESENKSVVVHGHGEMIKYYDPVDDKYVLEDKSIFFEKWTGVVSIPFTDEQSGDPNYTKHLKEERKKRLIHTGVYTGISFAVVFLLIQTICDHPQNWIIWFGLFTLKLIALLVVSQILKIELGESNTFIAKICKTTDCGKVLDSKASKLFSWLTMGDVGMMYFGSGILLLMIAPFTDDLASIVYLLSFLNLFTLPYTLFSIVYQRFVLKTWCPFCLTVMGLLWIEFCLGFIVPWTEIFPLPLVLLLLFGFSVIAVTIGWLVLKRLLIEANMSRSMRMYVNTVKKDIELFNAILLNKNPIPAFTSSSEIVLGNKEAKNVLIAVISPYCPSCAALYQSIQNFLKAHSDMVKVILRFKTGDQDDSWDNQIIEYLLTFNMKNMKKEALLILEMWYNMEYREINTWKKKCNIESMIVSDDAKQMRKDYHNWLLSVDIPGAPAMIFNKKLVPPYYTFDDIKYFLKRI